MEQMLGPLILLWSVGSIVSF